MKKQAENCKRKIILDTSAFLAGFNPFSLPDQQITVPKIEQEIKRNSIIKTRLETAIENGKVIIRSPSLEFQAKVETYANSVGDSIKLSQADSQLIAIALELKSQGYTPQIITDDYSIQNVATQIGVEFLSLVTFGIKRLIKWIRYCPACHKQYSADSRIKECQICGTALKRKPYRSRVKVKT